MIFLIVQLRQRANRSQASKFGFPISNTYLCKKDTYHDN